eukprot:COSAG03_NODE_28460_length_198_cov_25.939394_2_plen_44_part_01
MQQLLNHPQPGSTIDWSWSSPGGVGLGRPLEIEILTIVAHDMMV